MKKFAAFVLTALIVIVPGSSAYGQYAGTDSAYAAKRSADRSQRLWIKGGIAAAVLAFSGGAWAISKLREKK